VTNVDADHLDNYGTVEAYQDVFEQFLGRIDSDGFVVCCVDDPGCARLARSAKIRGLETIRVGTGPDVDVRGGAVSFEGESSRFEVQRRDGTRLGAVQLQVPGPAYASDALAALATGLRLGFGFDEVAQGLAGFRGSGRRMQLTGVADGVRVYDSYAHHPAEIDADLRAARAMVGAGRVVVCFQPHLFSRTRIFGAQMGQALGLADEVVVMDVYAAREDQQPGVSGRIVAEAVPLASDRVSYLPVWADAAAAVASLSTPGDIVLTLGAGDVTKLGPAILRLLEEREEEAL
ncbi:MAG: glutamate ligase domain-containing protein, partial [Nocardioidaceae bacterium]